jgi:hypothetical protein
VELSGQVVYSECGHPVGERPLVCLRDVIKRVDDELERVMDRLASLEGEWRQVVVRHSEILTKYEAKFLSTPTP